MPSPEELNDGASPSAEETTPDTTESGSENTTPEEPKTAVDAITQALRVSAEESETEADGDPEAKKEDPAGKAKKPTVATEKKPVPEPVAEEIEVPKDITNPKSQQRFRDLVTQVKEKDKRLTMLESEHTKYKEKAERLDRVETEYNAVRKDVSDFQALLKSSQATPEEFVQLLDYSKAVKSGDFQTALQLIDAQRAAIAKAAGMDLPGVDVFSDHPDIKQRVESLDLDKEAALELVRLRNERRAAEQRAQQEERGMQGVRRTEAAVSAASKAVAELAQKWQASDIDYAAKHPKLMEVAKEIAAEYPPEYWPKLLEREYRAMKTAAPATPDTPKPNLTPLRPGGGGGGNKVPKSAAEAVAAALGVAQ